MWFCGGERLTIKKGPGACVAAILVMVPDWEEGVKGRK